MVTPSSLRRGTSVYREHDPADRVYVVDRGTIGLGSLSADGKRGLLSLAGGGDTFGELAIVEERRSHDAEALEDCRLLSVDAEIVASLVRRDPATAAAFIEVLGASLRRSSDALRDAILLDVPGRLARRLCGFAEQRDPPAISQQALAQMVGASRETVNRVLARFVRQGLVQIHRGGCRVTDVAGLRAETGL